MYFTGAGESIRLRVQDGRGVVWRGVAWRGAARRGVARCGAVRRSTARTLDTISIMPKGFAR